PRDGRGGIPRRGVASGSRGPDPRVDRAPRGRGRDPVIAVKPRKDPEIRLRRYWEEPDTPVVTAGLSALSVGYRAALVARETAYRLGVLRTGRLARPVVSV